MLNLFFRWFCIAAMLCAAGSVSAQKVHIIIVADHHSDLCDFVDGDAFQFESAMIGGIDADHIVSVHVEEGGNIPQSVLRAIRNMEGVRANDAVVFYYSGHGAWDAQRGLYYTITSPASSINHFRPDDMWGGFGDKPNTSRIEGTLKKAEDQWRRNNPQKQHLLKSDVVTAIQRHNPRLTVVISDCCSSHGRFIPNRGLMAPGMCQAEFAKPLFRKLFFESSGLVDFCAAQEGRAGYSYTRTQMMGKEPVRFYGSAMTFALTDALSGFADRRMDWAALFVVVQDQTRKNANANAMALVKTELADLNKRELIPFAKDVSQYPKAFSLGNRAASARSSGIDVLGMSVEAGANGGVVVSKMAGEGGRLKIKTAATNAGFEVGDVITEVNDRTVNSKADFDAAVSAAGTVINFTVIDKKTGKPTIFPMAIYLPAE